MDDGTSYLTTGNSNYADAKGLEVAIRKPLSGIWGGYLNFSWSTGITGRSGDPDVLASPNSGIESRVTDFTGDYILYDPARLKFGVVFAVPTNFDFLYSVFADMQFAVDYQIYFPHKQIISDNFTEGGKTYIRMADKNADIRIRKEFKVGGLSLAAFIEVRNAFNDKWNNLQVVNSSTASAEDRVAYVNSNFAIYPELTPNGGAFPDVWMYRNMPRAFVFGFAIGF
jgi:hypothetical protein